MDKLKEFILSQVAERNIDRETAKELLTELRTVPTVGQTASEHPDVAIIGLAGRFSAASNADQFWQFLVEGRECVRDFPASRKADMYEILRNPYYSEIVLGAVVPESDLDIIYSKSGYLDRIDQFDAGFFGIPPLEATYMDPHQRIALEVAYEALENAGYGGNVIKGTRTGVFLGRDQTNYSYYRMLSERHAMQLSGSWEGLVASRISYLLDLTGPCLMTDTACSAGAVTIHQAIQSLAAGECDMALAGGINMSQVGEVKSSYMSGATMDAVESTDAAVRTFDARANGTVWGEGAGIVVLKPLAKAIADRDHIRAVIKGSAINNDGRSSSITAPNADQQERVILDAWRAAGIDPETLTYVEAHGTGTVLGDPIEVKGLTNAFRRHTARRQFCAIGSLKTTMGHMVGAAGVAAVTKVVKALEAGMLAPSANFEVPNPYIDFADSPLYVNDRLTPWDGNGGPRRACINSFGFIRTNAHLVLEEAPAYVAEPQQRERYPLTISAKSEQALRTLIDRYVEMLTDSPWSVADICFTSNAGRAHQEHRVAVIGSSKEELAEALDRLRTRGFKSPGGAGVHHGVHSVVSDRKRVRSAGDVTTAEVRQLTASGTQALRRVGGDGNGLEEAAEIYVRGANLDFTMLYAEEARRRVPLPTYPFESVRYWAEPLRTQVSGFESARSHPVLGTETSRSDSGVVFENTVSVDTHWVLADHRIGNRAVIPGTTYLEMARAALAAAEDERNLGCRFENVVFLVPLDVGEGEEAVIRTRLDRSRNGYSFQVTSRRGNEWVTHAKGRIVPVRDTPATRTVDIEESKRSATEVVDPVILETDTGVFRFGPRWDSVRATWKRGGRVLAHLQCPPGVDREESAYGLHPAMLDNAVNLLSQDSGTYLPYVYKSFLLYRSMPESFYSLIRTLRDDGPDGETITFDVDLVDADGVVFGEVTDYTVKKVDWERFSLGKQEQYLTLGWTAVTEPTEDAPEGSSWAVVVADTAQGHALVDTVAAAGHRVEACYLTGSDADTVQAALADLCARLAERPVDGVVFATDATADPSASDAVRCAVGVEALFSLTQQMLAHRIKVSGGMHVLVRSAWPQDGSSENVDPFGAATATLAVVIGQEHLSVDVIDGGEDVTDRSLVRSLLSHGVSPRRVRGEEVLTRRLEYTTVPDIDAGNSPFADGEFIVTGGTGGLGLALAERMAQRGARRIVLLGRREPEAAVQERIAAIDAAEFLRCDVADAASVEALADRITAGDITPTGIVHAAGVAGDGFIANKDRATFDAVLAPKVEGSLRMTEIARRTGASLVFFSSIAAVMGGQGQGDYSCANAFMDALAVRARGEGIDAIAVDWPTWTGAGMAADHGVGAEDAPFTSLTVAEGLDRLEQLLSHRLTGIIPAGVNASVMQQEAARLPFTFPADLSTTGSGATDAQGGMTITSDVRVIGLSLASETEGRVASIYGAVLGLTEVDAHAGFQELGGNSLMTAHLLSMIEEEFPGVVDVADLFSYSTVVDLAGFIDEQTGGPAAAPSTAGEAADSGALDDVLDEIGDSELTALFSKTEQAR